METRRKFLKTTALVPFLGAAATSLSVLPRSDRFGHHSAEHNLTGIVCVGKPVEYWLARWNGKLANDGDVDMGPRFALSLFGPMAYVRLRKPFRGKLTCVTHQLKTLPTNSRSTTSEERTLDARWSPRWGVERSLTQSSLDSLVDVLRHGDPTSRANAALTLRRSEPAVRISLPVFHTMLRGDDPQLRVLAAVCLAKAEPRNNEITRQLVEGLGSGDEDIRRVAYVTLHETTAAARVALPHLIGHLRDGKPWYWVVRLLGTIGPDAKEAIPELIGLLGVRRGKIHVIDALTKIGPAATEALMDASKDARVRVRGRAIMALAHIGPQDTAIVPVLIEKLRAGHPVERVASAYALGKIEPAGDDVISALQKVLRDGDIAVRYYAIGALGNIRPKAKAVIPNLVQVLREPFPRLQHAVFLALERIGEGAVPALAMCLTDRDQRIALRAAEAIERIARSLQEQSSPSKSHRGI